MLVPRNYLNDIIDFFFLYFQFSKQGNPIPTIKQKMNSNKHKLSFNLNQPLVSFNMTSVPLKTSISSIHQTTMFYCCFIHVLLLELGFLVWKTGNKEKKINNVISIIPWYKHNLPYLFNFLLCTHNSVDIQEKNILDEKQNFL